jgi:dipeptidyl aminopeptidase/acylaminoacyl peptidase
MHGLGRLRRSGAPSILAGLWRAATGIGIAGSVVGAQRSLELPTHGRSAGTHHDSSHAVTVDKLLATAVLSDLAWSPDGQWLAFSVSRAYPTSDADSLTYWVMSAPHPDVPRRLPIPTGVTGPSVSQAARSVEMEVLAPVWRPRSSVLTYLLLDAHGQYLAGLRMPSMERVLIDARPLAPSGTVVRNIAWSLDGNHFAYVVDRPGRRRATFVTTGLNANPLWAATVGEESPPPIPPLRSPPDAGRHSDLWIVAAATGSRQRVARSESGVIRDVSWGADGRIVSAVVVDLPPDSVGRFWETSPPQRRLAFFDDGRPAADSIAAAVHESDLPYSVTEGHLRNMVVRRDAAGAAHPVWDDPDHDYHDLVFAHDKRTFAVIREGPVSPPEIWIGTTQSDSVRPLVTSLVLNPQSAGAEWPRCKIVQWRSRDGHFFFGYLLLPPEQSTSALPLVVGIRGGPGRVRMQFNSSYYYPEAVLAAHGIAVFVPNSRGRESDDEPDTVVHWLTSHAHSYYPGPYLDVEDGLAAVRQQISIDTARIGIYGWSYGGGLAAYAISHVGYYRAASIGEASAVNTVQALFELSGLPRPLNLLERVYGQRSPFDSSERALSERDDFLSQAGHIRTPALLEFGLLSLDQRVGIPLYEALTRFGIPTELVVYPRTGHALSEPALRLDSYRRNVAWWDYWLLGRTYPDERRQAFYDAWQRGQVLSEHRERPDQPH